MEKITPNPVKFELHAYGNVYDISNNIANWKEIEIELSRDSTSGVMVELSFPFEFILGSYDIIRGIFDEYQHRSVVDVYIYIRDDNWVYQDEKYGEPYIFNLDFVDYKKSDTKIEIGARRKSINDFLKTKRKLNFEIPVEEIKEQRQWNFDRIELINGISELVDSTVSLVEQTVQRTIGISNENSEVFVNNVLFIQTIGDNSDVTEDSWFVENPINLETGASSPLNINIDLDLLLKTELRAGYSSTTIFLTKKYNVFTNTVYSKTVTSYTGEYKETIIKSEVQTILNPGERLYLIAQYQVAQPFDPYFFAKLDGHVNIKFNKKNNPVFVDLIRPDILLKSLVNKMTDTANHYPVSIENFNNDSNDLIMIAASESIRGITDAKLHTSYDDFVSWMNTFGYEEHIIGDSIILRKRGRGFRADLIAVELQSDECADLVETVEEEYLYSGLKIGYKKKEVENINGRYEFNGESNYSTDISLNEKILELISSYRADCFGIEFLAQERGKDTTDDKADKDVFLVNVKLGMEHYETLRGNQYGGNYPNNTIFNGNLNPARLVLYNLDLIGIACRELKFTGSDSNSEIIIDGKALNSGCDVPDGIGLFDPITYDIASSNIVKFPTGENINGIVRFNYRGKIHEGFIKEISKNSAWETETTWILYKKKG
ncbi:MAG: hypothetical protein LBJ72_10695 [Dysgonamonadaceae bacterium]|jgi:hypothetical protein|nr:hypothetical protein [Dysgonamonadaceae bacterium]